jgi:hypothetical protein
MSSKEFASCSVGHRLIALIIGAGMMLTYFYRPIRGGLPGRPPAQPPYAGPTKFAENVTWASTMSGGDRIAAPPGMLFADDNGREFYAGGGSSVYVITAAVRGRDSAMRIDGSGFRNNVSRRGRSISGTTATRIITPARRMIWGRSVLSTKSRWSPPTRQF